MAFLGSRWVGWALVASLALNLFLAGVIGVRFWREHWREGPERAMAGAFGPMGRIAGSLPESGRAKMKAVMETRQQAMRERSREYRRARSEAMQALSADAFDRSRAEAAFAEARRRADAMSEGVHAAMIEASSQLTPDERKAFRERLAERDRDRERDRERRGIPSQR